MDLTQWCKFMDQKKTAYLGLFAAIAIIFGYVESLIPFFAGIPGMKLGLANLVSIVGLYTVGIKGTIAVSLVRIVLVGFTFGNLSSMIYSLAGGTVSLIFMILLKKTGKFSQVGVSIMGGIGHNIGQLTAAALITETAGVFYYLPFLMVAGVIAGAVIGLLGALVTARIQSVVKRL